MKLKGPWSAAETERFLSEAVLPLRVACNGESGHPVLASLWFLPEGGKLWCATQRSARIVTLLRADPRCAFEASVEAPPYCGVRGSGIATLHDERGETILRALIDRYLGDATSSFASSLLSRAGSETAIAIEPTRLVAWDFTQRMASVTD